MAVAVTCSSTGSSTRSGPCSSTAPSASAFPSASSSARSPSPAGPHRPRRRAALQLVDRRGRLGLGAGGVRLHVAHRGRRGGLLRRDPAGRRATTRARPLGGADRRRLPRRPTCVLAGRHARRPPGSSPMGLVPRTPCGRSCSADSATGPTTSRRSRRGSRSAPLYMASASRLSRCSWCAGPTSCAGSARPLVAITGMTAYGIALLQLHRQPLRRPHHPVRLPPGRRRWARCGCTLAAAARGSVSRPPAGGSRSRWRSAVSALLVAASWSSAETRYPQSALAHVVPGGTSLSRPVDRLWDPRPAPAGGTRGRAAARRAHAWRGAQHRAHQRRPLGRDPDASRTRQRGAARRPVGGQLRPRAPPRRRSTSSSTSLAGGELMLLDGPGREAFDGLPPSPIARPLGRVRAGPSCRRAWPRCRSGC